MRLLAALSTTLVLGNPLVVRAAEPPQRVTPGAVDLPALEGPLPVSPESYPFNSAARTAAPIDLAQYGYVEEEYFVRGRAHIYDWPAPGELASLGDGPYTTRILVRRPTAARFNGVVVVEPLNSSLMADAPLMWNHSYLHFIARGYAWVGVTIKPVAGRALKRFDAQRYAAISFANPLPADRRCPDLELGPDDTSEEVGHAFDVIGQVGSLVRSRSSQNPLSSYNVRRVYLTGYSQTGGYTLTYANAISPFVTREDGGRIFDGYLESGNGPFNVVLNGCAKPFVSWDSRMITAPLGVPMIEVAAQGDVLVTHILRRPDSDKAPDLFRGYEVAGATHTNAWLVRLAPTSADFQRAGGTPISVDGCVPADPPLSEFPLHYALNAMWDNLDAWVAKGIPPPHATSLTLEPKRDGLDLMKDANGNVLAGVRSPYVDVPTAMWSGSRKGMGRCQRVGYSVTFDSATLRSMYPTHADYVRKVAASVRRLRSERWITPEDAQTILKEARDAPVP